MTDSLSKPISLSLAAHAGLLALFLLKMTFFPAQPIEIKRAIRVDLVGMPDKVQQKPVREAAAPKPEPVPTPAPAPKVEAPKPQAKAKPVAKKPDPKKIEKSQESAINRLKALAALESIRKEAEAQETSEQIKGNEVSKGNSLTGLEQIEYDRYYDDLEKAIYTNWALPEWLVNAGLRAQALVLIDENGHVIKKEIIKSSGDATFDAHVMSAIEKSSPFSPPPGRLKGVLAHQGIVFNFPE